MGFIKQKPVFLCPLARLFLICVVFIFQQTECECFKRDKNGDGGATKYASYDAQLADNAINVKNPPVPMVGAKGDDDGNGNGTDDTLTLQNLIDFAQQNGKRLYIPKSIYKTTKPLKVYGADNNAEFGSFIYGSSRGNSIIKKYTNNAFGNGANYDANAIIIIVNKSAISGDSLTDVSNITLSNIQLDGNNVTDYGIYMKFSTANCRFEDMKIKNTLIGGIYSISDNYLNRYERIRCDGGGQYGFYFDTGVNTSLVFSNCYVVGQTVAGFKIRGIYCHLDTPAADSVTGVVYDLTNFNGTVTSPGSECYMAKTTFKFGGNTNCTIINPYTYMNDTDNTATHILFSAGGKAMFIGGNVNFDRSETGKTSPGKAYEMAYQSKLYFTNTTIGKSALSATYGSNDCVVKIINDFGQVSTRGSKVLPSIGYDRGASSNLDDYYVNGFASDRSILGKAIFTDIQNTPLKDHSGNDFTNSNRNHIGDILLSNSPRGIGALGWVALSDLTVEHTTIGTVTNINTTLITLSNLNLDTFDKDGSTLKIGDQVYFKTSGAYGTIRTINWATGVINFWDITGGTVVLGEKIYKPIKTKWSDNHYAKIPLIFSGTTTDRPKTTYLDIGTMYFDATLNKPIWWNGTVWVDATGTTV